LDRISPEPLAAMQSAIRGLRLNTLKKQRDALSIELRNPSLTSEKIMALQKEILDLQPLINDLSTPAT
jgi:hypothetical protein